MPTIVNGAPMLYSRGIDDKSTRALVSEAEAIPTHLPKVYIYAKKGPTTPQLVVGNSRSVTYGDDSFNLRSKWATHATVFSNTFNSQGNSQMIERVKPSDAGPNASIRLYLDLLPTLVNEYQRNSDGTYTLDVDGLKIATGSTVAGYKAKWVAGVVAADSFGIGTQVPGDQVNTLNSTQSIRYPIADLEAPYFGSDGNNFGIRIWAPTINSAIPLDDRILANAKVYPFRIGCVYRPSTLDTPTMVETQSGEQFVEVSFKPGAIDVNTDSELFIGSTFIKAYQDFDSLSSPPVYGPFGNLHVYQSNLNTVLGLVYNAELSVAGAFSDFDASDDEEYRFNLISGVSSQNVPYHSFEMVSTGNFVRLSENSSIYADGGTDGTMTEAAFAVSVASLVSAYGSETSYLQDSAAYPESIIYDSGFPLATKYALLNFISLRKDTFCVLSTHDVLGLPLTATQENSLAVALRTRAQNFPESDYYGTAVCRAMIIGRSGRLLQSDYKHNLPLTLEVARRAAQYMGSGNGIWKPGFAFDVAPANQVALFTDVNVTFTPAKVRNKDWAAGLNWVQKYDRRALFFPAFKTVYDNDTSVLNSFFTAMACVELQKVGDRAWREFTGRSNLTNEQLVERVNKFIISRTIGRFDGRFVIQPETYFTAADTARGYSWTSKIKIYAPDMKTVETLSIEARRISDLTTTA